MTLTVVSVSTNGEGGRTRRADERLYRCTAEAPVDAPAAEHGYEVVYSGSEVPLEARSGLRWQTRSSTRSQAGVDSQLTTHEVVGTEKVVVAAGEFEALKVSFEHLLRDDPQFRVVRKGHRWYAPKIGLVRSVAEMTTTFQGGEHHSVSVEELTAFRP